MLQPFAALLGAVEDGERLSAERLAGPKLTGHDLARFSTAKLSGVEVVPHVSSHQACAALDTRKGAVVPPLALSGTEGIGIEGECLHGLEGWWKLSLPVKQQYRQQGPLPAPLLQSFTVALHDHQTPDSALLETLLSPHCPNVWRFLLESS